MIVNGSGEGTDTDAAASQVDHFTQQVFEAKGEKTFYCAAPGSPMKQHNQSSRVFLADSILCAEIRAQFNSQGPTEAAAAAAAKALQSCPTLCDPTDSSPPGSPLPGILQARTLEWVATSFSNAWK